MVNFRKKRKGVPPGDLLSFRLSCPGSRQGDVESCQGQPGLLVVIEAIANAVHFDAEDKAERLGTATTGVEATRVQAQEFTGRCNPLVQAELENDGAGVLLGGGIVGVHEKLALLDGEVDPVVGSVVPPVDTSQTHGPKDLEGKGSARAALS